MPPPNDYRLPPDIWVRRLVDGNVEISAALVELVSESRSNYDWPQGTGAGESQEVIIKLEHIVQTLLEELDSQRSLKIVLRVSEWGGNIPNVQRRIEMSSQEEQVRMQDAIRHVLNPLTLRRGLDDLSNLPGLRLVMATKIFRFCCPSRAVAVDRHASNFFNSLAIIEPDGIRHKSTNFKRQWENGEHTRSRMTIYSPPSHRSNCDEFVDVYLPLIDKFAVSLNMLGVTYRCAATGENRNWRPADVEMAIYYWGARHGSR